MEAIQNQAAQTRSNFLISLPQFLSVIALVPLAAEDSVGALLSASSLVSPRMNWQFTSDLRSPASVNRVNPESGCRSKLSATVFSPMADPNKSLVSSFQIANEPSQRETLVLEASNPTAGISQMQEQHYRHVRLGGPVGQGTVEGLGRLQRISGSVVGFWLLIGSPHPDPSAALGGCLR